MEIAKKVWYVTGASKGLGLSLVKQLLAGGYQVAAISGNVAELENALGKASENFLPLTVDLTKEKNVQESLTAVVERFGRIDVVVNNAGYGLLGSLEELSDKESRTNFEVNVFGMLNVIRNTMPYLRKQGAGHVFNLCSIGGLNGSFPGFSIYAATKLAVAGLSESLAAEAKPFGIGITVVYPGYLRADCVSIAQSEEAYQESIRKHQIIDPETAAAELVAASETKNPPVHLFLGKEAYELADQKLQELKDEMCLWNKTAALTGFGQ